MTDRILDNLSAVGRWFETPAVEQASLLRDVIPMGARKPDVLPISAGFFQGEFYPPPLISRTCMLDYRMILAEGIERQGSKHGHELRCGPKSSTNTRGCNLRHVYLQDTCLHLGL